MPVDLQTLWASPDQAGILRKHSHNAVSGWQERFFVLKGSFLFYFKKRHDVKGFHGVIPLEKARIQTEAPPGIAKQSTEHLCITITLNVEHAYVAKHAFYVLLAPSPEVQTAWIAALRQASIPRSSLIDHLDRAGGISELVQECTTEMQLCFPTEGAAVLSSSGHVRLRAKSAKQQHSLPYQVTASAKLNNGGSSSVLKDDPTSSKHNNNNNSSSRSAPLAAENSVGGAGAQPNPKAASSSPGKAPLETSSSSSSETHMNIIGFEKTTVAGGTSRPQPSSAGQPHKGHVAWRSNAAAELRAVEEREHNTPGAKDETKTIITTGGKSMPTSPAVSVIAFSG